MLILHKVIFRWWRITLRNDGDKFHPGEIKDSFEEYVDDENIQSKTDEIQENTKQRC